MRLVYLVVVVLLAVVAAVAVYLALQPATTPPRVPTTPTTPVATTPAQTTMPAPAQSITMCVIYNARNPVLSAQARAFKVAIEEINERGGIAGRRVVLLEEDHQSKADLTVAAHRRLVLERGCRYVILDGHSETSLAAEESAAAVYSAYPHVVMSAGQASTATTLKVINEYSKYKFYFRPFITEVDINYIVFRTHIDIAKNIIGARRVAFFVEDLLWTLCAREGCTLRTAFGNYTFEPMREILKREGFDVVYEVKIAVGEKNFMPMLEEAKRRGAEAILVMHSWFTDSVTLVKQWAASAARDIPILLLGGPNNWQTFWNMTGGDALGVITWFYDTPEHPLLRAREAIRKLQAAGVHVDASVLYYYSLAYLLKDAIERAGDPNNIEAVIRALEELRFDKHAMYDPEYAYLGRRDYLFHSYPAVPGFMAQFQCGGRVVFVGRPELYRQYYRAESIDWSLLRPGSYRPPAQLRSECPR